MMSEKCGENAAPFIARWGMYWACVLPKGHEGEHQRGGTCFQHGDYVGENCPKDVPDCIDAPEIQIPEPEPEIRSVQRRKALQRGEAMPTFTDHSIQIAELRAAIDEVGRMPHQFHCSVHVTPATVNSLVSEDHEENPNKTIPVLPSCTCYKSQRLAILRARLAEIENKAEEKIGGSPTRSRP